MGFLTPTIPIDESHGRGVRVYRTKVASCLASGLICPEAIREHRQRWSLSTSQSNATNDERRQRMSRSRRPGGLGVIAGLLALAALAGCTPPPKVVTNITNARDQVKFLYVQGDGQGVLKCQVAQDGALSQCRDIAVALDD